MTVDNDTNRKDYDPDGVVTVFAYDFRVDDADDLVVYEDGVVVESGYAVDGIGEEAGGDVTFDVAPLDSVEILSLIREVPLTQETAYPALGPFPASSHEAALDKLTFIAQQAQAQINEIVLTGGGNVRTSGTPESGEFARFISETEVVGRSASDVRSDLSLDNVDNTADSDKPISTDTQDALDDKIISDEALDVSDNTTNNATSGQHGFVPKLSGEATEFLNGAGGFSVPTEAGGPSVDENAIHRNEDGEIATIGNKATPLGADIILIEDSADSNAKQSTLLSALPIAATTQAALDGKVDLADLLKTKTYPTTEVEGVIRSGASFEKISGAEDWDVDGFYSDKAYVGGCTLSYRAVSITERATIGLSASQTVVRANMKCTTRHEGTLLTVLVDNSEVSGSPFTVTAADLIEIIYDGAYIVFKAGGSVVYSESAGSGLALYAVATFDEVGSGLTNVEWLPYLSSYSSVVTDIEMGLTGSGDESAALETALGLLDANTTVVFTLPQITCNGEVEITVDGLTLTTTNNTEIIANTLGVNTSLFLIGEGIDDITFDGLTLTGPTDQDFVSEECGIKFQGLVGTRIDSPTVKNCTISKFGFQGIVTDYADNVNIHNNTIKNCGYAAMQFLSSNDGDVSGNLIDGVWRNEATGDAYGIGITDRGSSAPVSERWTVHGNVIKNIPTWEALDTHGGIGIEFIGNTIENCAFGINVGPSPSVPSVPARVTIANNTMNRGTATVKGRGIGSGGYGTGPVYAAGLVITGNSIVGYGSDSTSDGAIMLQYTKGSVITGNSVEFSAACGITMLQGNIDFVVEGNTINGVDNGVSAASGISVRNGSQTGFIGGNNINSSLEYGMYINGTNYGVEFGRNRILSSAAYDILGGELCGAGLELYGEDTGNDLASIASMGHATFDITVTGALLGDVVTVSSSVDMLGLTLSGQVDASNNVRVDVFNPTAGALNVGSATYTAVLKKISR